MFNYHDEFNERPNETSNHDSCVLVKLPLLCPCIKDDRQIDKNIQVDHVSLYISVLSSFVTPEIAALNF
jgi:hypothetical protein